MRLLRDVRVLDLSTEIAGPYATKLLRDGGADVVKVEPPAGDPLRRWSASGTDLRGNDGPLFEYLNAGKRSVVASWGSGVVDDLIAGADLLVESGQLAAGDLDRLAVAHPALGVVSVTPFGRGGPWDDRPATEFIVQALSGSTSGRGTDDRPPLHIGGRIGEWVGGVVGAVTALAALRAARVHGAGEHFDVSMCEAMCIMTHDYAPLAASMGLPPRDGPERHIEMPSIEPTLDGYIGFSTVAPQMFRDFLVMIERADLLDDDELLNQRTRQRRRQEFLSIVSEWTTRRTGAEIEELASLYRIPVTPIGTPESLTTIDHFIAREVFVRAPSGRFVQPRPPYRVDDTDPPPFAAAPALDEHRGVVEWSPRARPATTTAAGGASPRPLAGLRVVDLSGYWAGPSATLVLAALGAEVVKVESTQRPDPIRFFSTQAPDVDQWWEWSPFFQGVNFDKRSVTLDLDQPEGMELLLDLVAQSDALVENFSPRVLDHFGLTWERVHAANPRAVMVRMPAFGLSGPWRDRPGFGQTIEQVSGIAWSTGYPDSTPRVPQGACDPLAGLHAVFALMAALEERDHSGAGHFVESSMVEAALNVAAEVVIEWSANGARLMRAGNRGPVAAPQGVYACAGEERWLAVAVTDDEQWNGLLSVVDARELADPALGAAARRRAEQDLIDDVLGRWCATRDLDEVTAKLIAAGVPAAPVVARTDCYDVEQFRARGFVEWFDHPVVGRHEVAGLPFRRRGQSGSWFGVPAPLLGQHNREILQGLLGVDDERLARLEAHGVVGTRPVGV
jgi:crotonobetainyl-CoA:carnitine CoA-transferase CaiB-like acyl-CoA transferase